MMIVKSDFGNWIAVLFAGDAVEVNENQMETRMPLMFSGYVIGRTFAHLNGNRISEVKYTHIAHTHTPNVKCRWA